ncbi:MAG: hypothetical protein AAF224_03915 [Pseudomonadota bacterium]
MTFQFRHAPSNGADAFLVDATNPARGVYGWLTPMVLAVARTRPDFARTVLSVPRTEQHFLALCAALMGARASDPDHLAAFARSYGVLSRVTLLCACDPTLDDAIARALVNVAPKFGGGVWRPATYRRLTALMADGQARKTLRHAVRITRRDVLTLSRLPKGFRSNAVQKIVRNKHFAEVRFAIDFVRRIRTDLDDRRIHHSIAKSQGVDTEDWVRRHLEHAPFPEPPIEALVAGDEGRLTPLTSYAALKRAALEFDNCIRNYLNQVLIGESYFYRYGVSQNEQGVAIVELRRMPIIGWVVYEALGRKNDAISGVDRAAILAAFRSVGVIAAPQAVDPNAWFNVN